MWSVASAPRRRSKSRSASGVTAVNATSKGRERPSTMSTERTVSPWPAKEGISMSTLTARSLSS